MPSRSETIREEAANVLLAQILRDHGLSARAERRSRHGAPDISVELRTGHQAIVECKWDGGRSLLEDQLDGRLTDFPHALGTFGVLYPEQLRHAEDTRAGLETADLQWWLHGSRGSARDEPRVRHGSVRELADELRTFPLHLEGVDRVTAAAGVVGHALENAAGPIAAHARLARRVADIIAKTDQEKDREAALRIGCLVLFNALAFQDRLAAANDDVPTVSEALRRDIPGLRDAWDFICKQIDYVPVFELALEIINVLIDGPEETQQPVIAPLLDAVQRTRKVEGHDLSGRLFHTLLTDAKFTGAYYTSVPAATLLTRLVFHDWPSHVDWRDHEFPGSLNVADLACGTGTLLMAVATEAERRHREAGGTRSADLHKAMVEEALHGYDVQLSAVHFAATSLAMLNPAIQFDRMNLSVMSLGAEGSEISLGSLDFLESDSVAVQFALSPTDMGIATLDRARISGRGPRGASQGESVTLPDLDLAIMNPPFTRSVVGNLLFGSLPRTQRRKLQDELSRRLKSRQASATAGLGAAFVAAAAPKLRPGEGRLALVLPATVCTGPSWQQTRDLIQRDFALDMVVTSQDPLRWNFSDSTDLSEALLIATRRPEDRPDAIHRTTFVNLWRNPDGVLDAHRFARAIGDATPAEIEGTGTALLEVDGEHVGEMLSMPESKLMGRQWSGVQFARADLLRSALRLLDDGQVWIPGESSAVALPLCPLSELGQIGPDIRDVRDAFDPTAAVTAYPMVANHDTEKRKRLATAPDRYLAPLVEPRPQRRLKPVDQVWPKSGRLLVGARFWLNTVRVVAMRSDRNVLASMWWPVRIEESIFEKALALYLNSSPGLLTLLAARNTTRGSWVQLKKADLQGLPIIDPRRLTLSQLDALSKLFEEMVEADFQRLPAMHHCPARRHLDESLAKILNLPNLTTLRHLLATEPTISNQCL
jgi:hypothetical protein